MVCLPTILAHDIIAQRHTVEVFKLRQGSPRESKGTPTTLLLCLCLCLVLFLRRRHGRKQGAANPDELTVLDGKTTSGDTTCRLYFNALQQALHGLYSSLPHGVMVAATISIVVATASQRTLVQRH